jgi:8-oxo-dGTP diphosphatase
MKEKTHCCYCGKSLVKKKLEGKMRNYCPSCSTIFYENPLPIASTIVVNEKREILLVQRKNEPYKDMWCLPIGFAESGEEIHEAALRELEEEAGIKGKILRLIDVNTEENYFYGSIAITTYEAEMIGGKVSAGDDASDAKYFPIFEIPELAWISNTKAIDIYIKLNKGIWAMYDSFKNLLPEITMDDNSTSQNNHKKFLSHIIEKIIERDIELISKNWLKDIKKNIPHAMKFETILSKLNKDILHGIQHWLHRDKDTPEVEKFIKSGRNLKLKGVSLPDILSVITLSRKNLWLNIVKEKIFSSPLEIYTTLEINNRIIFFYDKIIHNLTIGYFK